MLDLALRMQDPAGVEKEKNAGQCKYRSYLFSTSSYSLSAVYPSQQTAVSVRLF